MDTATTARDLFITGAKNAHGLEKQALSIMQPQVKRLEHYPEVAALLERHIAETEQQVSRLHQILTSMDESPSTLKDTVMSMGGTMAALGHSMADDEILKNTFANYAFENFEIASYRSLITMAESAGADSAIPLLRQSLQEEEQTAQRMAEMLPAVTERYIALSQSGQRADV